MVAVGGTAMVLMGLKESTKDVDFCISDKKGFEIFRNANIKSDFKVDLFHSGYIFCLQLPDDYIRRARSFNTGLKKINLKILSPLDLVVTKASRLNPRDIDDIKEVVRKKKIKKEELLARFGIVKKSWPGSDNV